MNARQEIANAARRAGVAILLTLAQAGAYAASPGKILLSPAQLDLTAEAVIEITSNTLVPLLSLPERLPPFAVGVRTGLNAENDGHWTYGVTTATWTLTLSHPGAQSLNLRLTDAHWPAGTELRLYDGGMHLAQGPYGPADLTNGELWTALVDGDRVTLELSTPLATALDATLAVTQVNIGQQTLQKAQATGCDISTACPEADTWTDSSRATAMITVGGRVQCTATLLNNTRRDGSPLMLTARHCGIGSSPDMPASSVVVYWNHEASRCDDSDNGSRRINQSGATLLATLPNTDGTLIRLNQRPTSAANAIYAGWDSTGRATSSGATLHHPRGTDKKISLFDSAPRKGRARIDDWTIESWSVTWSEGVTAPGSSGSALWNSQRRVIGHLSGGRSECGTSQGPDFYARLDGDWNGPADSALQPWLDPIGTGQRTLDELTASSNGGAAANTDVFTDLPPDVDQVELDVLQNDSGVRPLNLTSATADQGAVSIVGDRLVYRWTSNTTEDMVHYSIVDRMGHRAEAVATLSRKSSTTAGAGNGSALSGPAAGAGAVNALLLVLLLIAAGRRRSHP